MSRRWDTIIIGAGLGGLTAAARLVRAGEDVLVLDRNSHPGGTAYVYRQGTFAFPTGPMGFSNRKTVENILHDLDAAAELKWKRVNYALRAFNLNLVMSLPFTQLARQLAKEFPEESAAIESFFADVDRTVSTLRGTGPTIASETKRKYLSVSTAEYLDSRVRDHRLRRILGSLGTREPYASLSLQAAMWHLMCREGIWYPDGGLPPFCLRLVRAITSRHNNRTTGVIKLNAEVKRIRVEKGRVTGVILADGTAVDSSFVISNADYKATFLRLLGPEVPREWGEAVSRARQTGSILQVCLGLDEEMVDLSAFAMASRLIYRRATPSIPDDDDLKWDAPQVDLEALAGQELEISLWTREERGSQPASSAAVVIRTEAPYSHFARFRRGRGRRTAEYAEYKMRLAKALLNEAGKLLPGLEPAIRVIDVATPLTFEDCGGRTDGAVAGWSWDFEDFDDWRPRELVLTPISGLYLAGYQAFSSLFMGGVATAMLSGCRAADAVLDNAAPAQELTLRPN